LFLHVPFQPSPGWQHTQGCRRVVESGRHDVLKDGNKVYELAEGDCFGEIALLSNVKRAATVRCLTSCELMVLARDDFQTLTTGQGALAKAIRKQAGERHQ
jgi:CRP-like cAMP-binding protein